jgi:hypothetical protein
LSAGSGFGIGCACVSSDIVISPFSIWMNVEIQPTLNE